MFVVFLIALAAIQVMVYAIGAVWFVAAALRSRPISREEQERAEYRSLSWPADTR